MEFSRIRSGDPVTIRAKDDFFAFVDGWQGRVVGWNNGAAVVDCRRPDGLKTFFVPPDQLELNLVGGPG